MSSSSYTESSPHRVRKALPGAFTFPAGSFETPEAGVLRSGLDSDACTVDRPTGGEEGEREYKDAEVDDAEGNPEGREEGEGEDEEAASTEAGLDALG